MSSHHPGDLLRSRRGKNNGTYQSKLLQSFFASLHMYRKIREKQKAPTSSGKKMHSRWRGRTSGQSLVYPRASRANSRYFWLDAGSPEAEVEMTSRHALCDQGDGLKSVLYGIYFSGKTDLMTQMSRILTTSCVRDLHQAAAIFTIFTAHPGQTFLL